MQAIAKTRDTRISFKGSMIVCKQLKNLRVTKAKDFLNGLINKKMSIEGKHYTTVAKRVLEVLESAEANAKAKDMNIEKLFVKTAKADKAGRLILPKSRFKFRGREAKSTNIEIVLEER